MSSKRDGGLEGFDEGVARGELRMRMDVVRLKVLSGIVIVDIGVENGRDALVGARMWSMSLEIFWSKRVIYGRVGWKYGPRDVCLWDRRWVRVLWRRGGWWVVVVCV